ncbi:alpha/beta hydrolase [Clostridium sp. YIM B02505]|uniref:Alpha/beta hydrolase n=1 Tax=Clostridium yunnanense TaxID=2800325 RepID=A0ABS1EKQ7_9CLOT|nr:alpha/beta hydrolase [Clostridium yunnanense]MBK1809961.1 alpha/beta hydrolase [Clostridium yunnanense]
MKGKSIKKLFSALLVTVLASTLSTVNVMAKENIKSKEGLVNIGDKKLNAKIMGHGKVSVVFDSGYGDGIYTYSEDSNFETWGAVQAEIAKKAKTVAYDRTGVGLSDAGQNRPSLSDADINTVINGGDIPFDISIFNKGTGKTAIDRARDLHALLDRSKVKAPYILVVHSIAMFNAVEFAKLYPKDIAGIVSLDGTWDSATKDGVAWAKAEMPDMIDVFLGSFAPADGTLSEELQSELQVRNAGDVLRNIPLTILHPIDEGMGQSYQKMTDEKIAEWTKWSKHSKEILVPNTSHYIMKDNPQYVINAVNDMIKTVENRGKCK